jgi:hypothetical protein
MSIELRLAALRNDLNAFGEAQVQDVTAIANQVDRVVTREIQRVEENNRGAVDEAWVQNLKDRTEEMEKRCSSLKEKLVENLTVLKEREQENIALKEKLDFLIKLNQRPLPPGYYTQQTCSTANGVAREYRRKG